MSETKPLDLDAIRTRAARAGGAMGWLDSPLDRMDEPHLEAPAREVIAESANDVPALLAEVERLQVGLVRLQEALHSDIGHWHEHFLAHQESCRDAEDARDRLAVLDNTYVWPLLYPARQATPEEADRA